MGRRRGAPAWWLLSAGCRAIGGLAEIAHPGLPHWQEAEKTDASSCGDWPLEGVALCSAHWLHTGARGGGKEDVLELVHSLESITFATTAWGARSPAWAPLADHLLRVVNAAVKLDIGVLREARAVWDISCGGGLGAEEIAAGARAWRRELAAALNSTARALPSMLASPEAEAVGAQTPLGPSYLEAARELCDRLGGIAEPDPVRYKDCEDWSSREESRMRAVTQRLHLEVARLHVHAVQATASAAGAARLPRARFHTGLGLWRRAILGRLLRAQASAAPGVDLRMVEVGVDSAATAEALLGALPTLRYLGVDPFADGGGVEGGRRHAFAWLRLAGFGGRANLLRMTSAEAASWVRDASLDLVWVDARHTREDARADLRAWIPKLRPGGVVAGHDYGLTFQGIPLAVHEVFLEHPPADGTLHLAPDDTFFWTLP